MSTRLPHPPDHPDVLRWRAAGRSRVAHAVGVLADPAIVLLGTLVVVGVASSPTPLAGVGWALLAALFCAGLPYGVLAILLRRGHVSDVHVLVREQRRLPLLAALGCLVVGLGLLVGLRAPRPVVALVAAMLVALAVMTAISRWSKASFHVAGVTGAVVVLAHVLGPAALPAGAPVVALVAWARHRAGRHSVGQLAAGLLVGVLSPGLLYGVLVR